MNIITLGHCVLTVVMAMSIGEGMEFFNWRKPQPPWYDIYVPKTWVGYLFLLTIIVLSVIYYISPEPRLKFNSKSYLRHFVSDEEVLGVCMIPTEGDEFDPGPLANELKIEEIKLLLNYRSAYTEVEEENEALDSYLKEKVDYGITLESLLEDDPHPRMEFGVTRPEVTRSMIDLLPLSFATDFSGKLQYRYSQMKRLVRKLFKTLYNFVTVHLSFLLGWPIIMSTIRHVLYGKRAKKLLMARTSHRIPDSEMPPTKSTDYSDCPRTVEELRKKHGYDLLMESYDEYRCFELIMDERNIERQNKLNQSRLERLQEYDQQLEEIKQLEEKNPMETLEAMEESESMEESVPIETYELVEESESIEHSRSIEQPKLIEQPKKIEQRKSFGSFMVSKFMEDSDSMEESDSMDEFESIEELESIEEFMSMKLPKSKEQRNSFGSFRFSKFMEDSDSMEESDSMDESDTTEDFGPREESSESVTTDSTDDTMSIGGKSLGDLDAIEFTSTEAESLELFLSPDESKSSSSGSSVYPQSTCESQSMGTSSLEEQVQFTSMETDTNEEVLSTNDSKSTVSTETSEYKKSTNESILKENKSVSNLKALCNSPPFGTESNKGLDLFTTKSMGTEPKKEFVPTDESKSLGTSSLEEQEQFTSMKTDTNEDLLSTDDSTSTVSSETREYKKSINESISRASKLVAKLKAELYDTPPYGTDSYKGPDLFTTKSMGAEPKKEFVPTDESKSLGTSLLEEPQQFTSMESDTNEDLLLTDDSTSTVSSETREYKKSTNESILRASKLVTKLKAALNDSPPYGTESYKRPDLYTTKSMGAEPKKEFVPTDDSKSLGTFSLEEPDKFTSMETDTKKDLLSMKKSILETAIWMKEFEAKYKPQMTRTELHKRPNTTNSMESISSLSTDESKSMGTSSLEELEFMKDISLLDDPELIQSIDDFLPAKVFVGKPINDAALQLLVLKTVTTHLDKVREETQKEIVEQLNYEYFKKLVSRPKGSADSDEEQLYLLRESFSDQMNGSEYSVDWSESEKELSSSDYLEATALGHRSLSEYSGSSTEFIMVSDFEEETHSELMLISDPDEKHQKTTLERFRTNNIYPKKKRN